MQLFRRARAKQVNVEKDGTIDSFITSSVEAINDQIDKQEGKQNGKGYKNTYFFFQLYKYFFCFFLSYSL